MKIVSLIARLLLGVLFVVMGLNGFLQFIPQPPITGLPAQFSGAIFTSHYLYVVAGTQLICGVLLLVKQYVPLALAALAAVIVNILTFHITMMPSTIAPGLVVAVLWLLVALSLRAHFAPLLIRNTN
ncbi:MAG: hypothetical protein ACYDA1_04940 [Vulcanimicrobiaceae bacterium]